MPSRIELCKVIECNFHQGKFNIRTGEVVAPPCMVPIRTYRTIVEDGRVFVEAGPLDDHGAYPRR